ncbi:hypothetical protein AUC70_05510 [Methyloceanibacter stevinii]|uniref:NAD(P)-binding domain-containing protein n=1 Tax=Methyloceanibacter stevinii TaxID=1774970 RepID=A0A1E3VP73_9HYPH|nr:hypothetical protein AUC70_05510 [Methyloceanibacter stevinii]
MRILVLGGTGLIGAAVSARLRSDGHDVIRLARSIPSRTDRAGAIAADIAKLTQEEDWLPYLEGVDAVVNCAGALQDSAQDSTAGVTAMGWARCSGHVSRGRCGAIQISAIGVDRPNPTAFSRTKSEGDTLLMGSDLDWVILRPVVVIGRAAFGGSALLRALAAFPVLAVPADARPFQTVQLDDLTESVAFFLKPEAPSKLTLEVAAPDLLRFEEVVASFRRWFGWKPARIVRAPKALERLVYGLGDAVSWLGWRPPLRSTARLEIERGAVGDPSDWMKTTGIDPISFQDGLAAEPPSVQEKWFARLYLLKPVVLGVLALYWVLTGLIALGPGWQGALDPLNAAAPAPPGHGWVVAGSVADIAIGLGTAYRRTARVALWAALGLSAAYLVAGTILLPALWVDPLGPLVKVIPIVVLTLVALMILEER